MTVSTSAEKPSSMTRKVTILLPFPCKQVSEQCVEVDVPVFQGGILTERAMDALTVNMDDRAADALIDDIAHYALSESLRRHIRVL